MEHILECENCEKKVVGYCHQTSEKEYISYSTPVLNTTKEITNLDEFKRYLEKFFQSAQTILCIECIKQ